MKSAGSTSVDFAGPARYRIEAQGLLNESWRERLVDLTITSEHPEDGPARTTLVGRIRDQAELSGILDALYGLHMAILSVERLE